MEVHHEFMDTLVREYKCSGSTKGFKPDPKSISAFPERNMVSDIKLGDPVSDRSSDAYLSNVSAQSLGNHDLGVLSNGQNLSNFTQSSGVSSEVELPEEYDASDAIFRYIGQMLMEEEDLEHKPCMFQDCLALQATEKSFCDVLLGRNLCSLDDQSSPSFVPDQNEDSPIHNFSRTSSSQSSNSSATVDNFFELELPRDTDKFQSSVTRSSRVDYRFDSFWQSFGSSNSFSEAADGSVDSFVSPLELFYSSSRSPIVSLSERGVPEFSQLLQYAGRVNHDEKSLKAVVEAEENGGDHSPSGPRGKKSHYREDGDYVEDSRSNKQFASYAEESDEQTKMYDEVLLCPHWNPHLRQESATLPDGVGPRSKLQQNGQLKGSSTGRLRGKKQGNKKEVVDFSTLLTQCAQAVAINDGRTAKELLKRIRQHSSPYGDGYERLAHFFANALEARLAGVGASLYTAFVSSGISAADILKGYQLYIKACPFKKLSNFYANQLIKKLSSKATSLHIIDFGILYGFQWPCLIQVLSKRPDGPPKLRITGIDFPQPGPRPAGRVEETGRRLAKYCERFNVPFEYNAIAKKWETIQLEDLEIQRDEVLVVNCLYRLANVPDDTVVVSNPRDEVLKLIQRINPDVFVHGVVNGTYNAPFFLTRFREALFHFSSLFDMFDATVDREDQYRMLFERESFGRDLMNVIACEGTQRVERPETYKQWQVRTTRAGFRQLPLDKEIAKEVRDIVRKNYNKDFVVDEDCNWLLQGWKGRIIHAISCWKSCKEF